MKKSLAKAITLTLLLANTAFAANSVNSHYKDDFERDIGKIDLDGYGEDEIKNTAKINNGVLFDGGWYAPDGKFYCYVDKDGNETGTLQVYEVENNKAVLTEAAREKLGNMGLDHNSGADSVADENKVTLYENYLGDTYDKTKVANMLRDNLKFNSDLTRTLAEIEESERKETDRYLNWKVDNIKVEKKDTDKNSFTFINSEGEETTIDFTFNDTNTKLNTSDKGLTLGTDGKLTLEVKDDAGNIVSGIADVGEYIKQNAGNAYYNVDASTTINDQITINKGDIQTVKNNYVKNITQKDGDEYIITQIIDGKETPVTYKDKHITGFEQSIDEKGEITSTITTNFEEKPYQQTINISGYVDNAILYNAGNAYYNGTTTTINQQITLNKNNIADNTNRIEAVEKDYVKNIYVKDGDTLHITETVNGETKPLEFKDTHIDKLEQSIDKDGKITTIIKDNNDKTYTGTVDVGSYIKENAGDAYYDKENNITINEQIKNITENINTSDGKIDALEKDYVKNIEVKDDTIKVTQTVNGNMDIFEYTDKHVEGFTQSGVGEYGSDDAGKITSTIKTNYGESYSDTIDISGYVSDVVKNEAKDGSLIIGEGENKIETTIGEAINNNYNTINQIKNDYVQNITQEGDTLKITQNVDGKKNEFTFTDKHINSFEQSMDGYGTENGGKIISTIKDNVGNEYQQIIDVGGYISDAIKNEAGDAYYDKENKITINEQISTITGDIDSVKKNYVQNITQEGDTLKITQNVDGKKDEFTFTDEHINGFNQSEVGAYGSEDAGKITSTITTNKGEEYKQTIDISDYVSNVVKNEAKDAIITVDNKQTTIENAVRDNYTNITEVKNNYVKNVGVDDKNGVITIVQNKDGAENTIEYTDKHITGFNQSEVGAYGSKDAGKITSTITTNFGDKYESSVDISGYVSSTVKNEAKDGDVTVNGNKTTIENALQNNANEISQTNQRLSSLGSRINKVGAGAAALAALHPMDFDPDDKLTFSAGYGNYAGENAAALGMFYRPDEKVMFSLGGTMGNGENMVNAGISFALDRRSNVNNSKIAMAHEIQDLREQVARQNKQIAQMMALVSQLTGKNMTDTGIMFPDVPENHWAYDYIRKLAAAGIIEGYGDGQFLGDRSMTRYEFAAMLYRALNKGVQLDAKILNEFEPELGRIRIDRISGVDSDKNKVERVRVITAENRDAYGSKLN